MKKLIVDKKIILLSLFLVLTFQFNTFPEEKITIVYTNSLNGRMDDCACKENPNGGLLMRAEEIKKIKASFENVFLFETGDFLAPESDDILIKYVIKGYKYIGYDSISIGDQEFSGGIDNFLKYSQELPFICNNIIIQTGGKWESVFKRFQILERNNVKIGVIGTISETAFKFYPETIKKQIKIVNQLEEINKDIEILKSNGIMLTVLLSHSGFGNDKELAKEIKGLDLIVGGHSQTFIEKPIRIGDSIIVQAGADGARIGILQLILRDNKIRILDNSFRLPHSPASKEDSVIRKLINEYNNEVKKNTKKLRFN